MKAFVLAAVLVLVACAGRAEEQRTLTILAEGRKCEYHATELLKHPQLQTLTISVAAYRREPRTFAAIPAATIFKCVELSPEARVEFVARDGYTANLGADMLLNTDPKRAIAYLAVEDPARPWPVYAGGPETPGPFALIWTNPHLSSIGREQWPFKFNRIVVRGPLESTYPQIVPDPRAPAADRLFSGFHVFVKNCLACHKLNRVGPGVLGPDLSYPMSPTQYFREGILRQYIRDPQSVRAHPRSAMGPFPPEMIPDAELDNLILYLDYMSERDPP
ncbi:MAG TPA: cytochrome c [Steroidobacteraceae bacterium]